MHTNIHLSEFSFNQALDSALELCTVDIPVTVSIEFPVKGSGGAGFRWSGLRVEG